MWNEKKRFKIIVRVSFYIKVVIWLLVGGDFTSLTDPGMEREVINTYLLFQFVIVNIGSQHYRISNHRKEGLQKHLWGISQVELIDVGRCFLNVCDAIPLAGVLNYLRLKKKKNYLNNSIHVFLLPDCDGLK